MDIPIIVALLILVFTFALILTEVLDRTVAALLGALLVGLSGILFDFLGMKKTIEVTDDAGNVTGVREVSYNLGFDHLVNFVEFETIVLLMGMMIIVGILSTTGFFQWCAVKSYELSGRDIWRLVLILCGITALLSAFLDNVTTILLIAPVTLAMTRALKLNPVPILISEAMFSNIGGAATLIGDPPNIIIGSSVDIGFMAFIVNLAPLMIINFFVVAVIIRYFYGKEFSSCQEAVDITGLKKKYRIRDPKLFERTSVILVFVIVLFFMHDILHISAASAAIAGAILLLIFSGVKIEDALENVEWPTLIFFAGLFMIVGGTEEMGLIELIGEKTAELSGDNMFVAIILILWVSAFASSVIDNIPFTATMIPIIAAMTANEPGLDTMPLYWALSAGACLGGNGTIIGASANVVMTGIADRADHHIGFMQFLKTGMPVMVITVTVAMFYLLLRYAWT